MDEKLPAKESIALGLARIRANLERMSRERDAVMAALARTRTKGEERRDVRPPAAPGDEAAPPSQPAL